MKLKRVPLSLENLLVLAGLVCSASGAQPPIAGLPASPSVVERRIEEWRAARFGMFIHWGPVSLKGTEIGWSRGQQVPIEEYDNLYRQFNPTNFNPDAWMRLAREAGMKYTVFTTKHHDGFCMWDTRQTDFNIMHSPFGRDVVKELTAAARRQGVAFGTYHSVCDWHHPDFPRTSPGGGVRRPTSDLDRYEQYLRAQVSELITNYGPLWVMWFDVPQEFDIRRGQGLIDLARSYQPDLIVNNRSGAPGDYDTPEQRVGKYQDDRPWETCMTICRQWAWKPNDTMKSLSECLHTLVLCAGGDGNLLFNVGPMPDGRIEPRQVERLREMGAWLSRYGESIYGTRGGPWKPTRAVASTRKDRSIYLHLLRPEGNSVTLPAIPARVQRATVLTGGKAEVVQDGGQLVVTIRPLPSPPPAHGAELLVRRRVAATPAVPIDVIVKLDLDRPAREIPALSITPEGKATASNVYQRQEGHNADKAFDGDPQTRWATDTGTHQAWVANDFGKLVTFQGVRIQEAYAGRVKKFEFQVKEGTEWKPVFSGTTLGADFTRRFAPVTAREVRLLVLEASEGPTINEIELLRRP
jgi:alpha-L-fucosidase